MALEKKTQIYVSMSKVGQRGLFAEIAKVSQDKLVFYDIWPINSNIEDTGFLANDLSIGNVYQARITKIDPKTRLIFLSLGTVDAVMKVKPKFQFLEGQYLLVEITCEAYGDKKPLVNYVGDVKKTTQKQRPKLFRNANNLMQYCLKLLESECDEVICDDFGFHAALKNTALKINSKSIIMPVQITKKNGLSLLEQVGYADQVAQLTEKLIPLKGGSNIIIETTDALTAVDVNSANFIGDNYTKMINEINIAAANTLMDQLKLRQIGGLVVVDFLKYKRKSDKQKFARFLHNLAKQYGFMFGGLSNYGLAEFKISRKSKNLAEKVQDIYDQSAKQ